MIQDNSKYNIQLPPIFDVDSISKSFLQFNIIKNKQNKISSNNNLENKSFSKSIKIKKKKKKFKIINFI